MRQRGRPAPPALLPPRGQHFGDRPPRAVNARFNAFLFQHLPRRMADTHAEYGFNVRQQFEDRREPGCVILRLALFAPLTIFGRKPFVDQHHAGGREAVDREPVGVAKVAINHVPAA